MSTIPRTLLFALGFVLLYATPASAADKETGYIGVQIKKDNDIQGILVQSVFENSPAEKAGLMSNDVITKLDGKQVEGLGDFVAAIRESEPGKKIKLTIERGGKEMEITVTVGKAPKDQ
jgi:S1-C subfamily serine protease